MVRYSTVSYFRPEYTFKIFTKNLSSLSVPVAKVWLSWYAIVMLTFAKVSVDLLFFKD